MLDINYEQLMNGLEYDKDIRQPPDERRQVLFRVGWEDATDRHKKYTARTLRRLTWCNLGYRMGQRLGSKSEDDINEIYRGFAARYQKPIKHK